MKKKITIYPAAALFNGRETSFNLELIQRLEEKGYHTFFPQRDGFEFGRLANGLEEKVAYEEIENTIQQIIYFLDMGIFLPKSDVIIANLDEPVEEGVVIEMSYARLMDKFVIGYRTDVRSPYGSIKNNLGGIHFFPALQCNVFLKQYMPCRTESERKENFDSLAGRINDVIKKSKIISKKKLPDYVLKNPSIKKILDGASMLFEGVRDIHSNKGLKEISERYIKNKDKLNQIYPIVNVS